MNTLDTTPPAHARLRRTALGAGLVALATLGLAACKPSTQAPAQDAATPAAAPAATPAPAASAPAVPTKNAFRPTMTAVELASAYKLDAKSAKAQYARQPLLVTGMVADIGDGVVHLNAGDFPALAVHGLGADATAKLAQGQQVLLACDGADLVGDAVSADKCSITQ